MLMRSQRRRRARLVEGMDLERLPAANEASALRSADLAASDHARNEVVRSAIDELQRNVRDMVVLYCSEDLSLREIADRPSLTENAVRSPLHRARARLRSALTGSPVVAEARGHGVWHDEVPAFVGDAEA
jgi:RNA polymerase sigma-70 factor (ECF subfamily)